MLQIKTARNQSELPVSVVAGLCLEDKSAPSSFFWVSASCVTRSSECVTPDTQRDRLCWLERGALSLTGLVPLAGQRCPRESDQRHTESTCLNIYFGCSCFPVFKCELVSWRWSFSTQENWKGATVFVQNGVESARNALKCFLVSYIFHAKK